MKKGFTLIELMVVIAMIAIITAVVIPKFVEAKYKAYVYNTFKGEDIKVSDDVVDTLVSKASNKEELVKLVNEYIESIDKDSFLKKEEPKKESDIDTIVLIVKKGTIIQTKNDSSSFPTW